MEKIRIGVIGVGHLGSVHAKIYSTLDGVVLKGVCDCDKKRAEDVARLCSTKYYSDYKDLLNEVDAVSVVVPTQFHHKIAKDFLTHGIDVLVEKPITRTLNEADELLEIARKKKAILQVGHVERFNAAIKALKRISKGPRFIEALRLSPFPNRGTDVGVVLELMIHDIDIVLDLVRSRIKRLDAIGMKVLSNHEDITNARITFENGTVCNLTASRVSQDTVRKLRVFQEDAYVSVDYVRQSATLCRKLKNRIVREEINIERDEPLKSELKSFIECVRKDTQPVVSGKDGREALRVGLEILNKIKV